MKLTSAIIKAKASELGFDLCGIAPVERFTGLGIKTDPLAILPECRSVIVVAMKFLRSTLKTSSTIPYTIIRNGLSREIDIKTTELSYFIEEHDLLAVPTGAIEPCNYDTEINKTVGLISLKNAACLAGLGVIGKNTLLITPKYGNMVWLGGVLTNSELEPDPVMEYNPCRESCSLCISSCPVQALDGGKFMDQNKCWNHAFGEEDGGEWRIKCFKCRAVCPYSNGFKLRENTGV